MTAQTESVPQSTQALTITRVFNASRELVWKAWTDPAHIMKWWGPKNFTSPVCKIDFRLGGKYLFCMRSPEGQDYYSTGNFIEIVPNEQITYTDSFADPDGNIVSAAHYGMSPDFPEELLVIVKFSSIGDQTEVTLTHQGIPAGEMAEMTKAGWNESLDKLADSL